MAEIAKELLLRNEIARKSGLKFVCLPCLKLFRHQDLLYAHFKAKEGSDDIHQGFAQRESDFKMFLASYKKAMAWDNIRVKDLPINVKQTGRRAFYLCFTLEFVLGKKGPRKRNSQNDILDTLKELMVNTHKGYVCPICLVLVSWRSLRDHFDRTKDNVHQGLRIQDNQNEFLLSYYEAMGSRIPKDDLPLGEGRKGAHSFHECFLIDTIIKFKKI